jgi:phytanoyl-CoA hydroxylase
MSTSVSELRFDHGTEDHAPDLYSPEAAARGLSSLDDVTDAGIDSYHENGFLIIERAFSEDEIAAATEGLIDLIMGSNPEFNCVSYEATAKDRLDQLTPEQRQDAVRKLMNFCDYDERLLAISLHPRLLAVLERMLAGTPKVFQEMALIKPPKIGREKPWHQDHAYFKIPTDSACIGVWIALDDTTPENGCMHLMPQMYGNPILHFQRRDWQICDSTMQGHKCLSVPLKRGGCLFFSSLLPHGTPTNKTDSRRRALQFHYVHEDIGTLDPDLHKGLFGGEYVGQSC